MNKQTYNFQVRNHGLVKILCFLLIINPISHYIQNIQGIGNVYYVSYFCWLILTFYGIFFHKSMSKKETMISLLLLISLAFGSIYGYLTNNNDLSSFHRCIFIAMSYFCINALFTKSFISEIQLSRILHTVLFMGTIAIIYSFITQSEFVINILKRNNVVYNSWKYVSFFRQRNIFAEFCYLSSFASFFLFIKKRKMVYLNLFILFGICIFITNSRAALLAYIMFIGVYICLRCKNKYLIFFFVLIGIVGVLYILGTTNFFKAFSHKTGYGIDSGVIRLQMWCECFREVWNKYALIIGFGPSSINNFTTNLFAVESSHNSFVDALFEGGIVYLAILVRSIIIMLVKLRKKKDDDSYIAWLAFVLSLSIYSMLEAGMMIYESSYFSVSCTIILVLLPKLYSKNIMSK